MASDIVPVEHKSVLDSYRIRKISRLPAAQPRGGQLGQRAAIYARVSTADQCCERQNSELTAFAERGGFEVIDSFRETASGARDNRLARNRVLASSEGLYPELR